MSEPLIAVEDMSVDFVLRRSLLGRPRETLRAVDGITLAIEPRETMGLVGESGSGKSTTGRGMLRLVDVAGGSVRYLGTEVATLSERGLRALRRDMQMVFRDPWSSSSERGTPVTTALWAGVVGCGFFAQNHLHA